ncbi:MAG: nuclear transport factor 2 family protein [Gemmatimonadetes bacterium]|nr:nuclear transport factor 2 family protein [Gemmatimonadota bacterium]
MRALTMVAAAGMAAACAAASAELSPSDVTAIGQVLDVMPREFKAKNAEAVAGVFADQALLVEDGRINRGKASILNDHVKLEAQAMEVVTFQSKERVIEGRGGMAYTLERFVLKANDAQGRLMYQADSAWYSTVQEKQPDGSWKIVLGHWSSPMPPAPPPASAGR